MVVMQRRQRGGRRAARLGAAGRSSESPYMSESLYSFRTIVIFTISFLSIIMLVLIVPKFADLIHKYNAGTNEREDKDLLESYTGLIFHNVSDLPIRLIRQLDAVLVLGGGRPKSLTEPPLYVQKRCDDAAAIVRMHQQYQKEEAKQRQGEPSKEKELASAVLSVLSSTTTTSLPILCLSAGTAHVPQLLSADGLPTWESTACAAYLDKHYGDASSGGTTSSSSNSSKIHNLNVHVETTSFDTIGNAFFARTNHVDLHRDPTWRNLLIVTNDFHMERSKAIFDWIFSLPSMVSSKSGGDGARYKTKSKNKKRRNNDSDNDYNLFYLASPNVGLSDEAVHARLEKEMASLKSVQALSRQYKDSLSSVHDFLTNHHDLYTASKLVQNAAKQVQSSNVSDLVRKSYGGSDGGDGPLAR